MTRPVVSLGSWLGFDRSLQYTLTPGLRETAEDLVKKKKGCVSIVVVVIYVF